MSDTTTPTPYPIVTAADITTLYDAYANLPKPDPSDPEPTPVEPDPTHCPEGALPAALEFDGLHGRIICPIDAVLAPSLLHHPSIAEQVEGGVQSVKFDELEDGNWEIYLQGDDIHNGAHFALAKAELQALLARDNITLWGRPSDDDLAAAKAAQAAALAAEEAENAPPF